MRLRTTDSAGTRAIAMWDFSWLERRWAGGSYEDWGRVLDELVLRGYDVVRIDAYPHLVADGADWHDLVPIWDQHPWGSPRAIRVAAREELLRFIRLARDRGLLVSLSSWFREDTRDVRRGIRSPADLSRVWTETIHAIEDAGLLDAVWFVDLCNEWAQSAWAPFLFDTTGSRELSLSRADPAVAGWTADALSALRAEVDLPLCVSVSDRLDEYTGVDDHTAVDLLEPHVWLAQGLGSEFYDKLGYDLLTSNFDPAGYEVLARGAEKLYRSEEAYWRASLAHSIARVAELSRRTGLPLVTSEGWAVVNWRDGPGLDWGWVKELTAFGVTEALSHRQWAAVATSNFCGPQFRGMWKDLDWHRSLTDRIHATPAPSVDSTPISARASV